MSTVRAHLLISGRVQGVSFRWYTVQKANELNLTGWVRNCWDGKVEAVFEGAETAVQQAVSWCHRGSPSARVERVKVDYESPSGEYNAFRVKR